MAGVCFKRITPSARIAGYESTQSTLVSGKSEMCPEFQQVCRSQRNQAQTAIWLDAQICLRTEQINVNETARFAAR
jgi:hypothetical protein